MGTVYSNAIAVIGPGDKVIVYIPLKDRADNKQCNKPADIKPVL